MRISVISLALVRYEWTSAQFFKFLESKSMQVVFAIAYQ